MILSTAWQRQAQRAITLPEGSHIHTGAYCCPTALMLAQPAD
jgi:hypothetical protein